MNVAQPPLPRRSQPPATIADWLAIPEEKRAELIHGRIIYHAMPGPALHEAHFRSPYDFNRFDLRCRANATSRGC